MVQEAKFAYLCCGNIAIPSIQNAIMTMNKNRKILVDSVDSSNFHSSQRNTPNSVDPE